MRHPFALRPGAFARPGKSPDWVAGAILAACLVTSTTFQLNDSDVWEHLAVGKAIWALRTIPGTHLWSWPTYGTPETLPSWLFCMLLWPFWATAGITGLFVWRWLTVLAVFSTCLLTARRMGARSLAPLLVIAVCGLVYRVRTQVRPETLSTLILAIELCVLESRRRGGPDRTRWIIPLSMVWANAHISYFLSFVLLGAYLMPWATPQPRPSGRGRQVQRNLAMTALGAAAACFVNPFGWHALAQPIQYFFEWRHEPLFTTIAELHGIDWPFHARDGLLILMFVWPALQLWRGASRVGDAVEATLWGVFTALALFNQRFVGTWAVVAAVFLGRDLAWAVEERWLAKRHVPRWLEAATISALCVLVSVPEWSRRELRLGIGVDPLSTPVGACDFMVRHGIRGRIFNHFELGGYLLWRFWPERDRLPFMDIHQSGTPRIRLEYAAAMSDRGVWGRAAREYQFEVAIVKRMHARGDNLLNFLDADSTWSMVFVDDVAAVYVLRHGRFDGIANSLAYRIVPGGMERLGTLGTRVAGDQQVAEDLRRELDRMVGESAANSSAHSMLATLDMLEGRWESARAHLIAAHRVDLLVPLFFTRLAQLDQAEKRWRSAIENLERARRNGEAPHIDAEIAPLLEQLGDQSRAHRAYEAALELEPSNGTLRQGAFRTSHGR